MTRTGRPRVVTEAIVGKIAEARMDGQSYPEIAAQLGISDQSLYNYLRRDKVFREYMEYADKVYELRKLERKYLHAMGKEKVAV